MKTIKLTQGQVALVDDEDYEFLNKFKWHANKMFNNYYAFTSISRLVGKPAAIGMHQLVLDRMIGYDDSDLVSDHIDRNGLNNQRYNLRRVSHTENMQNRRVQGVSKYHGVCWHRGASKWRAQIRENGEKLYLGVFESEEEAARAYDQEAKRIYGTEAALNFDKKSQIKLFSEEY